MDIVHINNELGFTLTNDAYRGIVSIVNHDGDSLQLNRNSALALAYHLRRIYTPCIPKVTTPK